ncbi:related to tRNA nucleotidyltransferase [Phialocephala subalpina]|uniref:Related to tRNA nucleotidyltransferase n=1 Tax=Phialocephala subalpina TaxID=576137 RepID=A0A1L7XE42_9HELO|nr:related to tRNA nucleotidyltransferase [Phialocephala subalpina]
MATKELVEAQYQRPDSKMATTKITLTPRESQLRDLLLDVAHFIDESKEIKEKIELRWAGGWVRDKLLDIPSHDIDTAINSMTGYNFSTKMQDYLKNEENMKKHSLEVKDLGGLHKILANPEKSKHLETATTRILGFDVDFVNLRKETYTADSRNPQVEFGTAEEDALRRDATINALFYNLHSDQVEDFSTGLEDLDTRRIRTPLEPRTTFMDDPLRVLRLVRFASRLSFSIDPESEKYMSDPDVLDALKLKISRERVGVELEKMLKGNNPRSALQLIDRLCLYSTIFTDPTIHLSPSPSTENWSVVYDCLEELKSNETPKSVYQSLVRSDDAKYLSWILAALTPWSTVPELVPVKKGKLPLPLGAMVAREGIKADNKTINVVTGAFRNLEQITKLKDDIGRKESYVNERDTVGMSIRRWDTQGGHWRLQALYALLVEALKRNDPKGNQPSNPPRSILTLYPAYEQLFGEWQGFIDHLESMDIMDAAAEKSIIDGTSLSKALGGIKPGVWMKPALDVVMEWQLRNPGIKDPAGAIEEVKKRSEELKIPKK